MTTPQTPATPMVPTSFVGLEHGTIVVLAPFLLILSGLVALALTFKINLKSAGATCMTVSDKTTGLYTSVIVNILILTYISFMAFKMYKAGWKNYKLPFIFIVFSMLLLFVSILILIVAISTIDPTKVPTDDCVSPSMLGACKAASMMNIIAGAVFLVASRFGSSECSR
jgi:hypothetical protein